MNEHGLALLPPAVQAYIRQLEAHAAQASVQIDEAQQHIATLTERIALLEEQFRLAQLKRFAPKSEKQADRLFNEAEQIAAAEAGTSGEEADAPFALPETGLPPAGEAARGKRGRKPLPADLPRTRIEYDLPDHQKACACCGHALHRMGEQTSEQLHIEVKASVLQHVRLKYACRHCERHATHTPVVTAPMPAQPLPGANASPALIATVMTGKYADGTPLYRMEQALARANIPVGRGTLAHWVIAPAERHLSRLVAALRATLLAQPLIHGDETTMQVLKEDGKSAQSQSYAWVYRSAADSDCPVVLFDYQPGRGQQHPQAFLSGWHGTLMSDGYSAWRTIEGATHLGCAAHARRKFDEANRAQKKKGGLALQALAFFGALYEVEALARGELPAGQTRAGYTHALRQQHTVPLLEAFKAWLEEKAPQVLPESLLGKAIGYARNQWQYLCRYVDDGAAPIDNNLLERDIRPFTTGRKNWLFADTVAGAQASAIIYSLMLTCRACGVEPFMYLRHVLTELPQRAPEADVTDLLPFHFARQLQANTAQVS
jgi:transposase